MSPEAAWTAQYQWNERADARTGKVEDRVAALERRGYYASGFSSAIGAILGSGIVAAVVTWLFFS